jgi:hypothetical protein
VIGKVSVWLLAGAGKFKVIWLLGAPATIWLVVAVEVNAPVADTVVNAAVLAVPAPIAPGLGREDVEPPNATEVPAIVIAELLSALFGTEP